MKGATDCGRNISRMELFQSALPMKGATNDVNESNQKQAISIRAPNERSDSSPVSGFCRFFISIRAPNERSDIVFQAVHKLLKLFQSALPMKGATYDGVNNYEGY